MVSQAMFWDPLYADVLLLQLNEQRLANPAPFCDLTLITTDNAKFHAHKSILAACRTYFHQLLSSPPTTPPCGPSSSTTPRTDRVEDP
uniref:BTB domain-containing protein n=1 Tax=Denticeps clupeoides TaxID=299321 RepID=A0AAY4AQZ3_9TELE